MKVYDQEVAARKAGGNLADEQGSAGDLRVPSRLQRRTKPTAASRQTG